MSQNKRLKNEIEDVRYLMNTFPQFRNFEVNEHNILLWEGLIVQENGKL